MAMRLSFVLILAVLAFSLGLALGGQDEDVQVPKDLGSPQERESPYDWIKEDQIWVTPERVVINLQNAEWAKFTDTNSMDPVIDENSHALQIVPNSSEDIHIGDIISYEHSLSDAIIIHRVIEISNDGEWYAIAKGDNNTTADPGKVRFEQITRVLVAVIY